MANRAGLKKVQKTVKGKKGTVRRTYWVKANQAARKGQPVAQKQPGFLRRNAGKIVGGLALAGAAAYGLHRMRKGGSGKLLGAGNSPLQLGSGSGHTAFHEPANRKPSARERANEHVRSAWGKARESFTQWRRGEGAKLAEHMTHVGGEAAAEHIGTHVGSRLGGALGTAFGGGAGGAVGSFLGGHAGGFVARGRAAPHIKRGAEWVANRMQR